MKIKKKIIFFISLIFLIPILCGLLFFAFIQQSKADTENLVLLTQNNEDINYTKSDVKLLKKITKKLPRGIGYVIMEDDKVLISTIENIKKEDKLDENELISQIKNSQNEYIYQYEIINKSSENLQDLKLLTRIKKNSLKGNKVTSITIIFYITVSLVFLVAIVGITLISKSILTSINKLLKQTHKIAEGNLQDKIDENEYPNDELRIISESIEIMRKNLLEAQNKKSRFIMGVSHDLRTPVAVIKGYTEALSDGIISDEKKEETYKIILERTSQLEQMIDTLLDYIKLETKDWSNELQVLNFSEFIKNFSKNAEITGQIFKRKVEIQNEISKNVLSKFNPLLAQRGFENIFTNSIRYTNENDKISLKITEEKKFVIVSISDTGKGISEKDQKHIFDLFYRGSSSRNESGMGIGLSVVNTIAEIHNWKISINSKENIGTEFIIKIPKFN